MGGSDLSLAREIAASCGDSRLPFADGFFEENEIAGMDTIRVDALKQVIDWMPPDWSLTDDGIRAPRR